MSGIPTSMAHTSARASRASARSNTARAAGRRVCPNCHRRRLERVTLPLTAPLLPIGMCQVACGTCDYTATVDTVAWEAL